MAYAVAWKMPSSGIKEFPMFHVPPGREYFEENSVYGVREARRGHYASIDLDMQWTKADPNCRYHTPGTPKFRYPGPCRGHAVNTHWRQPMLHGFIDPAPAGHRMPKRKPVTRMTLDQALRLEAHKGDKVYRIEEMRVMFRRCRLNGVNCSAEAKWRSPNRWRMQQLMREATAARCKTIVKSAYSGPVRSAKAAGFQTRYTKDHRPGM